MTEEKPEAVLGVRLSRRQHEQILKLGAATGSSASAIGRTLIEMYLREQEESSEHAHQ